MEDPRRAAFIKELKDILNHCRAALFHIGCIENEELREVVEVHLDCLRLLDKQVPKALPFDEALRIGQGDLKRIQKKCIDMGFVQPLEGGEHS